MFVDANEQGTKIHNENGCKNFDYMSDVYLHKNNCEKCDVDETFSRVELEMVGKLLIDNTRG
jgi:hypothetical protein